MVIVGTGGIGGEVATRLTALGATCIGVRRRVDAGTPAGFARVVALDGLDALLPLADAIVLAAPLTAATRGLMNGARLDLLPAHAVVVNVARGPLLDEAALASGWPPDGSAARCWTCSRVNRWRRPRRCGNFVAHW